MAGRRGRAVPDLAEERAEEIGIYVATILNSKLSVTDLVGECGTGQRASADGKKLQVSAQWSAA
jgi:hypothetical protein